MSINPQTLPGADGKPAWYILSAEEWEALQPALERYSGWKEAVNTENDRRLANYQANPASAMDADAFFTSLDEEDAAPEQEDRRAA